METAMLWRRNHLVEETCKCGERWTRGHAYRCGSNELWEPTNAVWADFRKIRAQRPPSKYYNIGDQLLNNCDIKAFDRWKEWATAQSDR